MDGLFVINDGFDTFLLGTFFFGLVFAVLSLILGFAELGSPGHDGHIDPGGHLGHGHELAPGSHHDVPTSSLINVGTVLAFLMWFGGITYLLRNAVGLPLLIALVVGIGGGLIGASLILRFMRLMRSKESVLDARSERMQGTVGHVSSSIRMGGTGEIVYEMNGVRQVSAARSVDGRALAQGVEVMVLRREKGIAFVQPWTDPGDDWEQRFAIDSGKAPPDRLNS